MDDSKYSVKFRKDIKRKSFKIRELKREKSEKTPIMHAYLGVIDVALCCVVSAVEYWSSSGC